MAGETLRRVAVIGGSRIPFCRSNTLYADKGNLDMLTAALTGLVDRFGLDGKYIDEVQGGAVVTHSKDWNIAREAVIGTALDPRTPATTLMQACGTGLQAAMNLRAKIATGEIECGIACGSDTTSDAPIVFSRKFAQRLVKVQRAKGTSAKIGVFKGFRPGELAPEPPSVKEPRTGLAMGEHAELMAQTWGISREAQDDLAFESHRKAAAAYAEGFHDDLVVPFAGVFRDNNIRADIDREKLKTLSPVFEKSERGTLTAANSTPLTDGASAVLLASEEWARKNNLKPQAWMTYGADGRRRFRGGRRPADGADDCGVPDDRARRADTAGLRHLRDPRSLRRAGTGDAEGLGGCGVLQGRARPRLSDGRHRSRTHEPQGLEHRLRPPLRGDRRAHRVAAGEAAGAEGLGARADLDLHGGRHGRLGDFGGGVIEDEWAWGEPHP